MVDVQVDLVDGSFHEVDSSEEAFRIAGSMAVQDAARRAERVILEPSMRIEVTTPADYLGAVIGDVRSRRGKLERMDSGRGGGLIRIVVADVPLATMFGYATDLRSATQGRATFSMQFHHYAPVPAAVSDDIVSRVRGS